MPKGQAMKVSLLLCVLCGGVLIGHATQASSAELDPVVAANNSLAIDLLGKLGEEEKNIFFSPYSVLAALTMTTEGARGETREEMIASLHLPASLETAHVALVTLQSSYGATAEDGAAARLTVANALWGEQSYPFDAETLDKIEGYYGSGGLQSADFVNQPDDERQQINDWVARQTKDRILDLLGPTTVNRDTRLVLVNAIAFLGEWKVPFEPEDTREEPFTLSAGETIAIPLMSRTSLEGGRYGAFRSDGTFFSRHDPEAPTTPGGDGFSVLELPYAGERFSMVILLPERPDGLPALEALLSAERLSGWIGQLRERPVDVWLPRFELSESYSLNQPLIALGMHQAFDPRMANFDGFTTSRDPRDRLFISLVQHQAFLSVDEAGTEAAAATAVVMMRTTGIPPTRPFVPTFRADHPFLFLIRDRESGLVIFVGRLVAPRE